jgi:hypothetical protein
MESGDRPAGIFDSAQLLDAFLHGGELLVG